MPQSELLIKVVRVLEKEGIAYMATGSIASSLQGEPRATHDLDLVVELAKTHLSQLLAAFPPPDYYLDDTHDFWLLTDEPFDRSRFTRRRTESFLGLQLMVSSPEDTILAKLRWAKLAGGSEKQYTDALRVYEVQYTDLDLAYLALWASTLDVQESWQKIRTEAVVIED